MNDSLTPRYFGCVGETGYFVYGPDTFMRDKREDCVASYLMKTDGKLAPKISGPDGGYNSEPENGVAKLYHLTGSDGVERTWFSFWDNSIDDRPNSSSTFVVAGCVTFAEAVVAAREAFPKIWERYEFEVVECR